MSAAPYPADTRAKGWRFELDYEQIEQSSTWALAGPEGQAWALKLWLTAWRQVPCGSLPNDEEVIGASLGMQPKQWARHRRALMRGWWAADDGRLYHDTITRRVLDMLAKRAKDAERSANRRARLAESDASTAGVTGDACVTPPVGQGESNTYHLPPTTEDQAPRVDLAVPPTPPAPAGVAFAPAEPPAKPPRTARPKGEPAPSAATWDAYSTAYRTRYSELPVRDATLNSHLSRLVRKLGADEAPAVARFYVGHQRSDYVKSLHDASLLVRDAAGLRTQWATQRTVTATQALQADRTQTTFNAFAPMLAEARAREAQESRDAERAVG